MACELQRSPSHRSVRSAEWALEDHLLLFHGKIYVPKDKDLRRRIIEQHHDSRVAGHPGWFKTLELVSQSYWWPGLSREVGLYMKTCDLCSRTKPSRHKLYGELHPMPILDADTTLAASELRTVIFPPFLPCSNSPTLFAIALRRAPISRRLFDILPTEIAFLQLRIPAIHQ